MSRHDTSGIEVPERNRALLSELLDVLRLLRPRRKVGRMLLEIGVQGIGRGVGECLESCGGTLVLCKPIPNNDVNL
jgi:hypothetical protein